MIKIEIADNEAAMLLEILENDLTDLRMEVANTDSFDVRERLKLKEVLLGKMLVLLRPR
jgi:hypothetical protein